MAITIEKSTLHVGSKPASDGTIVVEKSNLHVGSKAASDGVIVMEKSNLHIGSRNYIDQDLTENTYPGLYIDGEQIDEWLDDFKQGNIIAAPPVLPDYLDIEFVGSGLAGAPETYNFSSLLNEAGGTPTLQEGDIVIVSQLGRVSGSFANISPPTGYEEIIQENSSGAGSIGLSISLKVMGSTPDTSVAIPDPSGTTWDVCTIFVLRNVDPINPIDVEPTSTRAFGTQIYPASINPLTKGSLILVSGGTGNGGAAHTNTADFSSVTNHFRTQYILATFDPTIATALKFNWQEGGVSFLPLGGPSNDWVAITLALRPKEA
jgi:hypothetical protein